MVLGVNPGTYKGYSFTVDPASNCLSRMIDPKEYNDYVLYATDYKKPKLFSSEVCIFKTTTPWQERMKNPQRDLSSHFALCTMLEFWKKCIFVNEKTETKKRQKTVINREFLKKFQHLNDNNFILDMKKLLGMLIFEYQIE